MKEIKEGKPYRKHKCSKCKSVYIYHIHEDKGSLSDLIYCPICDNYLDTHLFDKKLSTNKYNKIKELEEGNSNE